MYVLKLINRPAGILTALAVMIGALPVQAIEIDGSGDRTGLAALYLFKNYNPTTGVVPDTSGVGAPLDLQVDLPANVQLVTDNDPNYGQVTGLKLTIASVLRSISRADKILACGQAGGAGLTADVYVRNLSEEPVGWTQPTRIMTLSRLVKDGSGNPARHEGLFFVGQQYISNGVYTISLSGGGKTAFSTPDSDAILMFGTQQPIQRVTYTLNDKQVARLWVTNAAAKPQRYVEKPGVTLPSNWATQPADNDFRLAIGNEPFYSLFPRTMPDPKDPRLTISGTEWKSWLGTVYALAIYCRGIEPQELLGDRAGNSPQPVIPLGDISSFKITPAIQKAHLMFRRITGMNTPITNPVVSDMAVSITNGDPVGAALVATRQNNFYNVTVRDLAARMSTRDLSVNSELNDMVATIIGVVRDDRPATELLTGNYRYQGREDLTVAPSNEKLDFQLANNHYRVLQEQRYDLAGVLTLVSGQKLYNGSSDSVVINPEPAGVLTSRAFLAAHTAAGTNRRAVEFTFKLFMCKDIAQWSDLSATDAFVGRDVDRAPGADHDKYMNNCRACHSVMDGFRGAFGKYDFSSNYVKHADFVTPTTREADNDQMGLMYQMPAGIAGKYARNPQTFPEGYETTGTYWQNNANIGLNKEYFGWPAVPAGEATHKGYGIKSFAKLISQAKAFPRCMAMRAFRSVCKRAPGEGFKNAQDGVDEVNAVYAAADKAVADGKAKYPGIDNAFSMRDIFANVVALPQCTGN